MKITNILNLPQPIYDAIVNKPYTKGQADYSITQLAKPPRATALESQHYDELEQDVSDMIWSLIGTCAHEILDRAEAEAIPRDRMYMKLQGKTISGANDRFIVKDGLLQDYKVTSVWKAKKGMDKDWTAQLNGYVMLLKHAGYEVRKAQIVAILRDWSKPEAAINFNYPPHQIMILDAPIWPFERTTDYFCNRIMEHELAKKHLPLCTDEERWKGEDVFAVKKHGAQKAYKVYDTIEAARYTAEELTARGKGTYVVEERLAASKRCAHYCLASKFCEQYKAEQCKNLEKSQDVTS